MRSEELRAWLKSSRLFEIAWPTVRGLRQEAQVHHGTLHYRAVARLRGIPDELTDLELQSRLARTTTRVMPPKEPGDLHVYYATPFATWERDNIPDALLELGELSHFYISESEFGDDPKPWPRRREEFEQRLLADVRRAHSRRPIDVMVCYLDSLRIRAETIHTIRKMGIRTCGFWLDDGLSFQGSLGLGLPTTPTSLLRAYDLNLTSYSRSVTKYLVEGGLAAFWPEGANPKLYRPRSVDKTIDVSFVGAMYGLRRPWIDYLRSNGIEVQAYGRGWPDGPASTEAMTEIYCRSKIVLGFGGIGYSMRATNMKARDFEVPMCGSVYLTSDHYDFPRVFEVGREIETYRSKQDMLVKVRHLLANPDLRERIGRAGRERCLRDHTWRHRFERAFALLGVVRSDRFPAS